MITLFVVLGLGFLCGGAFAVADGWPYLVLERGFTQVIVGTVALAAGVILLALARVLAELRRIKTVVSSAMMAVSLSAMAASVQAEAADLPRAVPEQPDAQPMLPGIAVAGLGAGAALAATRAPPAPSPDEPDERPWPQRSRETEAGDRFGEAALAAPQPAATDFDALLRDLIPARPVATEPFADRDWPEAETVGPDEPADSRDVVMAAETAAPAESESAQASAAPLVDEEADGPAAKAPGDAPAWPGLDMRQDPDPVRRTRPGEGEEFAFLRDRLPGSAPVPDDGPAPAPAEPDMGAAEAWMEPEAGRREPWFDGSRDAATQAEPDKPEALFWQDRNEAEPAFDAQAAPSLDVREDEPDASGEGSPPSPEPTPPAAPDAVEAEPASAPAASEEGIVGAYQVGGAHFTIYANGSIQARTPDGDYSFGSMDELKDYLASEKNRLDA